MSLATPWRPERRDIRAMLVVALIPILLALPQLTPWVKANPAYYVGGMGIDVGGAAQPGVPYIDPNSGFQTQALGYRAVVDWFSGEVPWWNPYSGIGMPLAAEYQGAAFFPLTLLVALPRGMVLLQMVLQIVAGVGAYALARQLGLARLAAFAAGAMFAVNGTLAWLSHGPAGALPWLPWILLGIERARIAASSRQPAGWRTLATAMAMSLLAGFPETAYINGLFALSWAILRAVQAPREARTGFGIRVAAGGAVALAIAAPQVMSFFLYLGNSHIGAHAGQYADAALEGPSILMTVITPYVMGPIFGYAQAWPWLHFVWGGVGGYATAVLVVAALYGFMVRRDALGVLLFAWVVTTVAKSIGIQPFVSLWNLVPGVTAAAFHRYAQPSWELALMLLAARGIDSLLNEGTRREALPMTRIAAIAFLIAAALYGFRWWLFIPQVLESLRTWFVVSAAWALLSAIAAMAFIAHAPRIGKTALVALLVGEATVFCAIPILSNPLRGRLDMPAIEFLRANLGLQRFYTLQPIAPNYGALFGIASINHNYLPVPDHWVRHVHAKLDRTWTDAVVFNGDPGRNSPAELKANLANYEDLGVKYVVSRPDQDPLAGVEGVRLAYQSEVMKIWELPDPSPYFEDPTGSCTIDAKERRWVIAHCDAPSALLRRELFYPGWTATVNGAEATISPRNDIFQSVHVPKGSSEIRFRYAPPGIGWAWLVAALGLATLITPSSLLLRRKNQ